MANLRQKLLHGPFAKGTIGRGVVYGLVLATTISFFGNSAVAAPIDTQGTLYATTASTRTISVADFDQYADTAPMPDLKVTVSQTQDLMAQGIVISWSGGKKSSYPSGGNNGSNFLQIMQCWGDDPSNPGHPDRTTCQAGAFNSPGVTRDSNQSESQIQDEDRKYTVPGNGFFQPPYTSIPFISPSGTTVSSITVDNQNLRSRDENVDMSTNEFFTQFTSNEITWAGSGSDGNGSAKFEVQTAQQSPGLGCGEALTENGITVGRPCWLVVIPRGTKDNNAKETNLPGLFWDSWKHNIAFRLGFRPLGVRCNIGVQERQVSGTELANLAMSSWQPELCKGASGAAIVVSNINEQDALRNATSADSSPLALTSFAYQNDDNKVLRYAPLAVGGAAITFAIDRRVSTSGVVPSEVRERNKLPFTSMNLTPRLIAKLLTASYRDALPPSVDLTYFPGGKFTNPSNLTIDPDFLAVNDLDWQYQLISSPSVADALMPNGRTDLIYQLWKYVMADQDARNFLNGDPDPWGTVVNPWFSTNATINPTHIGMSLPRDDLPKSDPVEKPDTSAIDLNNGSGAINLVTWRPYISDFDSGAYQTLRGDGLVLGGWQYDSIPPKYRKSGRTFAGSQKVISLSTTPATARYQTVTASLLNPAGEFVAPTRDSMYAAEQVMTPDPTTPAVSRFDFESQDAKDAKLAYPLTLPVYAAINPLQTDAASRAAFANLIRYAVSDGQIPGTELGQLPDGYAPLMQDWVTQALNTANLIQAGIAEGPIVQPTTTPAPSQEPSANPEPSTSYSPSISGEGAKSLVGPVTIADPQVPLTAGAVPFGAVSGLILSILYPMFRRRKHGS